MKYTFLAFILIITLNCKSQITKEGTGIMFYNLENLYDTINDPAKDDEVFLPEADRKWNKEKYEKKLDQLSKVISTGAGYLPALVGLCEVENEQVVRDLAASKNLQKGNYAYIHFDSPDERGIDVALLYDKKSFSVNKSRAVKVELPSDSGDQTRDILFVEGELEIKGKKETLYIFVNHWPSRSEGEEVSAPKRIAAATVLKGVIDSLNTQMNDPNIIIMGDLNDTPYDNSVQQVLKAREFNTAMDGSKLTDLMAARQRAGEGSYNYKGKWQALDHIIVSNSLLDQKGIDAVENSATFVKQDWMMFTHEKYGVSPDRTYSGTKYIGGYSDHLPVFVELVFR